MFVRSLAILILGLILSINLSHQRPSMFNGRDMDLAWKLGNQEKTSGYNERFRHQFFGKFIGAGNLAPEPQNPFSRFKYLYVDNLVN